MLKLNKISIVVPFYNEINLIDKCIKSIQDSCKKINFIKSYQIIMVDDCSDDKSFQKVEKYLKQYSNIKLIKLSKNYGSHIAITAGINQCKGSDAIIVCPVDDYFLSKYFSKMLLKHLKGNDIVWSLRQNRKQSFFSKIITKIYYKLFIYLSGFKNYPPGGTSSFFLISKKVFKNFSLYNETNRVINILIFSMGFKQGSIEYEERPDTRTTSFTFYKKLKIAIDSIVSHSYVPMRLISLSGIIISLLSFSFLFLTLYQKFFEDIQIEGWTSLIVIITLIGGVQLMTLGVLGEYLWRTSSEVKNRPLYLINQKKIFK